MPGGTDPPLARTCATYSPTAFLRGALRADVRFAAVLVGVLAAAPVREEQVAALAAP